MVRKNKNGIKRYLAIVKINNNSDGSAYCVKYKFDNLLKFTQFLDRNWKDWKWFNVFSNKGNNKGKQIGSFTNKNKPKTSTI